MSEQLGFLFVCCTNAQRSPTAEELCRRIVLPHHLHIEATRSVPPGLLRERTDEYLAVLS